MSELQGSGLKVENLKSLEDIRKEILKLINEGFGDTHLLSSLLISATLDVRLERIEDELSRITKKLEEIKFKVL